MDRSKDYIQQLSDYIKRNLAKGYTLDSLRVSLTNQGYSRIAIDNAINLANEQLAARAPPMVEKPQISYKVIQEDHDLSKVDKSLFKKVFGKLFKR